MNPRGTVPVVTISNSLGRRKDEVVFADSELILDALGAGKVVGETDSILLVNGLCEDEKLWSDHWRQIIESKQILLVGKFAVLGGSVSKLRLLVVKL